MNWLVSFKSKAIHNIHRLKLDIAMFTFFCIWLGNDIIKQLDSDDEATVQECSQEKAVIWEMKAKIHADSVCFDAGMLMKTQHD